MPRKTSTYNKLPWTGGLNTAVEAGILPDNDLVIADNVVFASSGARIKREGFDYLDKAVPTPTFRSSSGTTRTVYFDTAVQPTAGVDEILAVGERIKVTTTASGNEPSYTTTTATVATIANSTQITDITTVADVSDSLDGTVFILEDTNGTVGFWFDVDDSGTTIPAAASAANRAVEITTIVTDDTANDVATKVSTAVNADSQFSTSVATNVVTVTDAATGYRDNQSASTSGFTVATTTPGTALGVITYTESASLTEAITATSTLTVDRRTDVLAVIDYWRTNTSNVKTQLRMSATDQGKIFTYDTSSRRAEIDKEAAATALPTTPVTKISHITFNNSLLLAFDGASNHIIKYNPDNDTEWEDLGGTPPVGSILQEHLGRVWTNDKTRPERLHYSETGNSEVWNGAGDSGAIDIGVGDGDASGITAIFPPFKGRLIVAKGNRLYQLIGEEPETFQIVPISSGVGCESHGSVTAIDQDDVAYISRRGVHTVAATASHGDFEGAFLSKDIQPTFNDFKAADLDLSHGQYIPHLNSIAFAVTDITDTSNAQIYLYNTIFKTWYRWPNQSCTALGMMLLTNVETLVIGTSNGRILQTQNGKFTDFGSTATPYKVKTGTVYPGGNPNTLKLFRNIKFLFRPVGGFSFTATVKIDNQAVQNLTFSQTTGGDKLDDDFFLGVSALGVSNVLAPESRTIDGIGRGIVIEIAQETAAEQVEIQGFIIEYQELEQAQEVIAPE